MFASKTIAEHLVRGALGLASITVAIVAWPFATGGAIEIVGRALAALAALVMLRGCPMCWLYGLVETVVARVRGRAVPTACTDGSCARAPRSSARSARPSDDTLRRGFDAP